MSEHPAAAAIPGVGGPDARLQYNVGIYIMCVCVLLY